MALEDKPLTSLQSVILTTGPFVFFWSTLRRYISRNGAFGFARPFTRLNNQLYALFSLGLGCLILNDVFHFQNDVAGLDLNTSDLAYIYHLSKFYEYLDVFNLVAAGTEIGPHMAFHHITTPFLTYFRILNASDWQLFAFLNCLHHFLLYSYLAGVSALRPILPLTGWLQLGGGIGLDIYYCVTHGRDAPESTNRAISIMILTRYAMLFYEELKGSSARKAKKAEQKVDEKKQ